MKYLGLQKSRFLRRLARTVIFSETIEVFAEALESLSEKAEPLGWRVFWIKTKIHGVPVSCENLQTFIPRGRPQASYLRQVESYLKERGMAGMASAWGITRQRPRDYCREVDAATRCFDVCPHT